MFDLVGLFVAAIAEFVLHPIGVVILRLLTLGRYPPKNADYNHQLVASVPLVIALAVVTVLFS